jgi:hypothetical protein
MLNTRLAQLVAGQPVIRYARHELWLHRSEGYMLVPALPMVSARRRETSVHRAQCAAKTEHGTTRLRAVRYGVRGTSAAISDFSNRQLPCSWPYYRIYLLETTCAARVMALSVVPSCQSPGESTYENDVTFLVASITPICELYIELVQAQANDEVDTCQ